MIQSSFRVEIFRNSRIKLEKPRCKFVVRNAAIDLFMRCNVILRLAPLTNETSFDAHDTYKTMREHLEYLLTQPITCFLATNAFSRFLYGLHDTFNPGNPAIPAVCH